VSQMELTVQQRAQQQIELPIAKKALNQIKYKKRTEKEGG
jgi:hypothetical protein